MFWTGEGCPEEPTLKLILEECQRLPEIRVRWKQRDCGASKKGSANSLMSP